MRLTVLSFDQTTQEQAGLYREILNGPRGQGPRGAAVHRRGQIARFFDVPIDKTSGPGSPVVLARGGLVAPAQITGVADHDFFDWGAGKCIVRLPIPLPPGQSRASATSGISAV